MPANGLLRLLLHCCSERAEITAGHGKVKKELQDMAEAMKVGRAVGGGHIQAKLACPISNRPEIL